MNDAATFRSFEKQTYYLLSILSIAAAVVSVLVFQISLNQLFAVLFASIVLTLWFYNRVYGLTSAVIFFMLKPCFLRIAYQVDTMNSGSAGFDLLGITPAVILIGLITSHLYFVLVKNEKLCPDKTRKWLMIFSAICFASIFFPTNSIFVGLGGFERNILPNMFILFLAASVFKTEKDIRFLLTALLFVGVVSVMYGIGQYINGIYPWEIKWFHEVGFASSKDGWLTIGLRGIEFRIFSMFYYRTDFFFTNILIFTMLIAFGKNIHNHLRPLKYLYYLLWFALMIITFERTPFILSMIAVAVIYFMNAAPAKKKILLTSAVVIGIAAYSILLVFEPYLKNSGVNSLIRLAEMTNPLQAGSIHDRADNYWGPSLEIIKANPLGVGIGHASSSKASSQLNLASSGNIYTHNEILQKVLETGYAGGLAFIILMIYLFRDAVRLSRSSDKTSYFGQGMTACIIVFMMSAMLTLTFSGGRGLTFWLLAGIVLSMLENHSKNKQPETVSVSKAGSVS